MVGEWRVEIDFPSKNLNLDSLFRSSFVGVNASKSIMFVGDVAGTYYKARKSFEKHLHHTKRILDSDNLIGVLIESGEGQDVCQVIVEIEKGAIEVELDGEMYHQLAPYLVEVNTKYKIVDKKVRPVVVPLPADAKEILEKARLEPMLRDPARIGHVFTPKTGKRLKIGGDGLLTDCEIQAFKRMVLLHGKALAFTIDEIGCIDPQVVPPMVVFTIPHLPWNLKPIPVPKVGHPPCMLHVACKPACE